MVIIVHQPLKNVRRLFHITIVFFFFREENQASGSLTPPPEPENERRKRKRSSSLETLFPPPTPLLVPQSPVKDIYPNNDPQLMSTFDVGHQELSQDVPTGSTTSLDSYSSQPPNKQVLFIDLDLILNLKGFYQL